MSTLSLLLGREVGGLFRTSTARIAVSAFLILSAVYLFVLNPFFVTGRATLKPFFEFVPFMLTFFAPALTMRAIAEERAIGTLDVLQTLPVGEVQIVLTKFLSATLLYMLALGFTVGLPIAVSWAGPLDWGPVFTGYFGLLLLGAACLAIGLAASAVARSQLVAFLTAFFVCFLLHIIGRAEAVLPSLAGDLCAALSFETRFSGFARGLIDSRDVVYFLSVIMVSLAIGVEGLRARRW